MRRTTTGIGDGIANARVRAAVEAFAEAPSAEGSMDVLRACLQGALLLDITGSEITLTEDGSSIAPGSTVQVAYGSGPDGEPAALAYTSQAELTRAHPEGTAVQSLVQPATAVLADVQANDHRWLYIDPAGPTCALSRDEIDFALKVPRNDAVREALEVADADPDRRGDLVDGAAGRGLAGGGDGRRRPRGRPGRGPGRRGDRGLRARRRAARRQPRAVRVHRRARRPSRARRRPRWPSSRPPTCRTCCAPAGSAAWS